MSTSPFDRLATYVANSQGSLRCPFLHANGEGTLSNPLCLSMLLRHADMADEVHPDTAYAQTSQIFADLNDRLSAMMLNVATPLRPDVIDQLKQIIREANPLAFATGTYYSVAIAVLAAERLAIVGIGYSKAWVWRGGVLRTVMEATALPIPGYTEQTGILTAALGAGFAPGKVLSSAVQLDPLEMAVIAMQAELPQGEAGMNTSRTESIPSPYTLLSQIESRLSGKSPLIAIMKSAPPNPKNALKADE